MKGGLALGGLYGGSEGGAPPSSKTTSSLKAAKVLTSVFPKKKMKLQAGPIDAKCLAVVRDALKDPLLLLKTEAVRLKAHAIGSFSHWFEGCDCHEDLLRKHPTYSKRCAALKAQVGATTCHWKSRRATSMALGHINIAIRKFNEASSPLVERLLAFATDANRTNALTAYPPHPFPFPCPCVFFI